jgi:hypothetical protein
VRSSIFRSVSVHFVSFRCGSARFISLQFVSFRWDDDVDDDDDDDDDGDVDVDGCITMPNDDGAVRASVGMV